MFQDADHDIACSLSRSPNMCRKRRKQSVEAYNLGWKPSWSQVLVMLALSVPSSFYKVHWSSSPYTWVESIQHHNITMVDTSSLLWTASALKQLRALQICMSKRLTCIHLFHGFSHKSISTRTSKLWIPAKLHDLGIQFSLWKVSAISMRSNT